MCPFVDNSYTRCAAQMTLRNLTRAFALCADRYVECSCYRELQSNVQQQAQAFVPALAVS